MHTLDYTLMVLDKTIYNLLHAGGRSDFASTKSYRKLYTGHVTGAFVFAQTYLWLPLWLVRYRCGPGWQLYKPPVPYGNTQTQYLSKTRSINLLYYVNNNSPIHVFTRKYDSPRSGRREAHAPSTLPTVSIPVGILRCLSMEGKPEII